MNKVVEKLYLNIIPSPEYIRRNNTCAKDLKLN